MSSGRMESPTKGTPSLYEELVLAYLLPSYQTYTSRLVRAQEEYAWLLAALNEEIDSLMVTQLLQKLAQELRAIEYSIEKEKAKFNDFVATVTHLDKERMKVLEQVMKQLKEINQAKSKIDNMLFEIKSSIRKIDSYTKILEEDNNKKFKELHALVKTKFSQMKIEKDYHLNVNEEGKSPLKIDVNRILDIIRDLKLQKIKNRDKKIDLDHGRIVDKYIRESFENYKQENNLTTSYEQFIANNTKQISEIKKNINGVIDQANINEKANALLNGIKRNEKKLENLNKQKEILNERFNYLTPLLQKIEIEQKQLINLTEKIANNDISSTENMAQDLLNLDIIKSTQMEDQDFLKWKAALNLDDTEKYINELNSHQTEKQSTTKMISTFSESEVAKEKSSEMPTLAKQEDRAPKAAVKEKVPANDPEVEQTSTRRFVR